MPSYTPPLRDMQFLMHEVFKIEEEYKVLPQIIQPYFLNIF